MTANDAVGPVFGLVPGSMAILNVAILLFITFFFTSTISSHILEYIAGLLNLRGRNLIKRLKSSLGVKFTEEIYKSPLIRSLVGSEKERKAPSYIDSNTFASALLSLVKEDGESASPNPRKFVPVDANMPETEPGYALLDKLLADPGKGPGDQEKIMAWFDALNERLNGTYTRWSTGRLLLIGLVLAGALDIDAVSYARSMFADPQLAGRLVDNFAAAFPTGVPDDLAKLTDEQRNTVRTNW